MKGHETFFKAQIMEKNRLAAARMRARYLMDEIDEWLAIGDSISLYYARQLFHEISYLFTHATYTEVQQKNQPQQVTTEMIEHAKSIPITNFVPFTHGKAKAWCHNDKRPSLYHATRKNLAICPVCDRKFGPIDIIMECYNMTFFEAVRHLN